MQWWGNFTIEQAQRHKWHIGERAFVIERQCHEWRIWNIESDYEDNSPILHNDIPISESLDEDCLGRHLQTNTTDAINIMPALADRPIVARPASTLQLLTGEQVQLFISAPLWFQVRVAANGKPLLDTPFWRPSDTWFGPSTRQGELCYAKYTDARLQVDQTVIRPQRAITAINVINQHSDPLVIERINIPVPMLALFVDENQQLWTEGLTLTREASSDTAELKIGKEAPECAGTCSRVADPRNPPEKRTLIRSISSFFA